MPNGLTVILLEEHSFPLVSVQMLYQSGSAAEVSGKTGLAHFLEHLAFRGSAQFPNARATELIYDSGGEWHGYTALDQTTYFATMPADQLDLLLRIEADRMARVVIDPAAIDAEKGAVITELHSYENDPASVLQEAVTRTALQAHPYGSPMAGYVSDVERLTIDDARAYYASHYAPGNAVLAIVGDFAPVQAKALVAKDFADVAARPAQLAQPDQRAPAARRAADPAARCRGQAIFQFAYPAPAASSPDFPAFLLLQEIVSGGSGLNLRQTDWAPTTPAARGSFAVRGDRRHRDLAAADPRSVPVHDRRVDRRERRPGRAGARCRTPHRLRSGPPGFEHAPGRGQAASGARSPRTSRRPRMRRTSSHSSRAWCARRVARPAWQRRRRDSGRRPARRPHVSRAGSADGWLDGPGQSVRQPVGAAAPGRPPIVAGAQPP